MRGAFRLARRLVLLAFAAAALGSCGALAAIRERAPETVKTAIEWGERAKDALGEAVKDALPGIAEIIDERVAPAFAKLASGAGGEPDDGANTANAGDAESADGERSDADGAGGERSEADGAGGERSVADGEIKNADGPHIVSEQTPDVETADEPPVLRRNPGAPTKLALTFDDGPHPTRTAAILDLLAEYGVRATFFVIGENAEAHPELVERELAEGHEVANHTMTHAALSRLSYRDAMTEVMDAEHAIFPDGSGRSTLLRPPCGAVGQQTLKAAERLGMSIVLWSVDTRDWEHKSAEAIIRTVREGVTGGDIILFHDFVSGESHTLEALETLIPELIGEGYEFVTVSELFGPG